MCLGPSPCKCIQELRAGKACVVLLKRPPACVDFRVAYDELDLEMPKSVGRVRQHGDRRCEGGDLVIQLAERADL